MAGARVVEAAADAEKAAATEAVEPGTGAAGIVTAATGAKVAATETFPRANPTTAEATVREPTRVEERTPAVAVLAACLEIGRWAHVVEAAAAGDSIVAVVAEEATAVAGAGW